MTLIAIDELRQREHNLDAMAAGVGKTGLLGILTELRGLQVAVVAGAAADTNIAVTGIATEDTILACVRLNRDATAANIDADNLTAECLITSAGNIQMDTTTTTGDKLIVFWYDKQ